MVYVKLFGPFAELMPEKNSDGFWETELDGKTIEEALLGFNLGEIKHLALVNNNRMERDYVLKDGDKLGVMPLLAGG